VMEKADVEVRADHNRSGDVGAGENTAKNLHLLKDK
jgi:hypothetical protein